MDVEFAAGEGLKPAQLPIKLMDCSQKDSNPSPQPSPR